MLEFLNMFLKTEETNLVFTSEVIPEEKTKMQPWCFFVTCRSAEEQDFLTLKSTTHKKIYK